MSKKTRKKSPKTVSGKATPAKPVTPAKRSAVKPRQFKATNSSKNPASQSGRAPAGVSQKAPSKALKSSGRKVTLAKVGAAPDSTGKTPAKSVLNEGAKAPAFRLPRDGGGMVALTDYPGQKLVLFFYPRADTPGCTREAVDFTRLTSAFAESGTAILGVSADPPKAQEAFRDKHQLSVPLISDEKHQILEAYGVWGEKSMYGKTFKGILRTTVLIGDDRRILKIWRRVKVDGHADEVLAAVRSL